MNLVSFMEGTLVVELEARETESGNFLVAEPASSTAALGNRDRPPVA